MPSIVLMENAGRQRRGRPPCVIVGDLAGQPGRVSCAGRGNNGGDGLVVARACSPPSRTSKREVFLCGRHPVPAPPTSRPTSRVAQPSRDPGHPRHVRRRRPRTRRAPPRGMRSAAESLTKAIGGVLTVERRPKAGGPRVRRASWTRLLGNRSCETDRSRDSSCGRWSRDVNASGRTGGGHRPPQRAPRRRPRRSARRVRSRRSVTVTLAAPKPGVVARAPAAGAAWGGQIVVADIGIPEDRHRRDARAIGWSSLTEDEVATPGAAPPGPPDAHKGRLPGACWWWPGATARPGAPPCLAGRGALRGGCGPRDRRHAARAVRPRWWPGLPPST